KLVKEFVQRGRPQTLLDNVHILGEPARGLGYVSGHSAVAVALATVASPYLDRRGRRIAWTLALLVCLSRVYVGAHLPLDVLGGEQLDDELLAATWQQVALLHRAGIAHGELLPANVMLDAQSAPCLVDFDRAAAAADQRLLQRDTSTLAAALTRLVGP